ncbi:AraC family transcriptional regulator [Paenibacillus daejeonensis]|uniref:AraC family transcriptional regulator n=1 Tax=Paenibacillus daejeonensis TaxID=135193 RepID=UPI000376BF53|nr:AraC family transcriptional regulator [Paenibacillus daejeonensis]
MNPMKAMNEAIAYIEQNLREEPDLDEAARRAHCSIYHFKRMFSFLAGIPLSDYIRRRRLSLAALELREGAKVIDVALAYGYSSPDAFARAFQNLHGMSPSQAREDGRQLKTYPRMSFQLMIRGGEEMNYRLEEKPAFGIVGLHRRVPIQFEGVNPAIAEMWQELGAGGAQQLKSLSDIDPRGMISASTQFSEGRMEEQGELDHYIGVATTQSAPSPYVRLEVPALTWAVFTAVGPFPSALQEVWGRIYAEWFPSSGYESVPGPELLWNEHPDTDVPDYHSEIWIPVKKSTG